MKKAFLPPIAFILITASIAKAQPKLVPVAQGWARNQVNAVIFRRNSIASYKDQQYVAFYDAESTVVIAKRKIGSQKWELVKTQFKGNTSDAHNSISIAVDGAGYLHLSWDNHNAGLSYAKSTAPGALIFAGKTAMIGDLEKSVTYAEFYRLTNGDLLFFYRNGASGSGDLVLNRYDVGTQKWTRVQSSLIDGERQRNAYPQIAVDSRDTIHISWVWRETPDVATNHDLCYARSRDGGKTWQRSSGERYILPITAATAEYLWHVPQNSELINQTSMTADADGRPYIATYWRSADSIVPQYRLVYQDGKAWQTSQISSRKTPFSLSGAGTKRIPVSRPLVLADRSRIFVVFRDAERNNRVSVATSDAAKKNWKITELTDTDVGMWEPTFDPDLWRSRHELNLFIQKVGQGDSETLEHIGPQMISILEWKP